MTKVIQRNDARLSFATLSAMRAHPGAQLKNNDIVMLAGGSSQNDGVAGGLYVWDSSSTATDDGAFVIKLTDTATGRFESLNQKNGTLASGISGTFINAQDYGVTGNGTTDDTTAIQNLFDNSIVDTRHRTVWFPAGDYKVTSTITISEGVYIMGDGIPTAERASGNTNTSFRYTGSGNLFVWSASGDEYGPGGIEKCNIDKASGTGGTAITVETTFPSATTTLATFVIRDVSITSAVSQTWAKAVNVQRSGSTGYHSIYIENLFMNLTEPTDYATAFNFEYANVKINGLNTVNSGTPSSNAGMTLEECHHVSMVNVNLGGVLTITNTNTVADYDDTCYIQGFVGQLDCNSTVIKGVASISSYGEITNQSPRFKIVSPHTCSFRGHRTSNAAGVTGDSTEYLILYNVEDWDENSSFDETTGLFTAKISGRHEFSGNITLTGLSGSHTRHQAGFVHRNSGATIQEEIQVYGNPENLESSDGYASIAVPRVTLDLVEGDTVEMRVEVHNNTPTVAVHGSGSSITRTYFEGRYVG